MRETNDWFHRRKGAFDDALTATERLLDVEMKPRWQLFLTTKLLPELNEFLRLVDQHRLRKRLHELGGEFKIFMHPPGPDYEARRIEELRPRVEEIAKLPESILGPSRKHFGKSVLWHTEETLYTEILNCTDVNRGGDSLPEVLWFFVCNNWDVFANVGTLEDWWCLGNLKRDTVESIVSKFENDKTVGLTFSFLESPAELARQYGNPEGQKVYSSKVDLLSLYLGIHCEKIWKSGR